MKAGTRPSFTACDPQGADALALLHEAAREVRALYAQPEGEALPGNAPTPPGGTYVLARVGAELAGCGALRPLDAGVAEVRRMYVRPAHRRHGVAHALLQHLQAEAQRLGYHTLRLETGDRQHAALALYVAHGFTPIAPWGEHAQDPTSRCFERVLPDASFLNFSYGSNMLTRRLRARTPSALPLGTAVLHDHALHWHKAGQDGSGKCDVRAAAGAQVHGVVYRIARRDKPLLDAAEGLGAGYDEAEHTVHGPAGAVRAWLYVATHIDATLPPYDWYHALVLAGAHEHRLPPAYIAGLQAIAARADRDAQRAAQHFALARAG